MFTILPESRAPRTRRLGGTAASVLAHGVLIAGAVGLGVTGSAGAVVPDRLTPRDTIIFVTPTHREARRPQSSEPSAPPHAPEIGFRPPTHVIDVIVPTILPPIDATGPVIPPEDVVIGRGGHTGVPDGMTHPGDGTPLGSGGVVGEHETDRAPHVLGATPEPRYPESLRAAGISGRVVLQFVVDTTGRAELPSITIQEATRPEFADAVRAALARFRFTAGEVAGRKVRTRVQIPFEFSLR